MKVGIDGYSLMVQWLGHPAFTTKGAGSVAGWETKISQGERHSLLQPPEKRMNLKEKKISILQSN